MATPNRPVTPDRGRPGPTGAKERRTPLADIVDAATPRLAAGAVAGLSVGLLALVASMGWAVHNGRPPVAPMAAAATSFNVAPKPTATPANLVVGLVTHLAVTALFGIGFAVLIVAVRRLGFARGRWAPVAWVVGYGLALYVVNFQILGRTAFPVFGHLGAGDQAFNVAKHAAFGLLLLPFVPRSEDDHARRPSTRHAQAV